MNYAYYPGCSLRESAVEYDVSVRAVMERLGAELTEIPDWTCCGASAVDSVDSRLALGLPARNLALAERETPGLDILVPCSACYLNLYKARRAAETDRAALAEINSLIGVEGLSLAGKGGRVRHLLDILQGDVGPEAVRERVVAPLTEIRVAPYYGCQILRPYPVFDDPERPVSMEPILRALGAEVHPWAKGSACCGASLMATHKAAALVSVGAILRAATAPRPGPDKDDEPRGADVIVTVCPLCQMNLDAYQNQALRAGTVARPVTVLYLSQLIALAFGLPEDQVLMGKNLAVTDDFRARLGRAAPKPEVAVAANGGA